MTRGIYTKWIIVAAFLLLILATGCILYYQHSTAADKHAAQQADKRLQQWKADKSKPTITAEKESTNTPAERIKNTAEKPNNNKTTTKPESKQAPTAAPAQATVAEMRVSKFGFGPYPELPANFPWQDLFDPPYYTEDPNDPYKDDPDYELMDRLYVELWKRGNNVEGMGTLDSTGLFYPTIRGTIYVEWAPRWKIFGQEIGRKVHYINGHPDDLARLGSPHQEGETLTEKDIPSDLKVLDISEGIDPYKFLNLTK